MRKIRVKEYLIKKGRHRSTFCWRPTTQNNFTFYFSFDDTAKYILEKYNQPAINKLVGFSDGTIFHHKNSFRIGWNYNIQTDCIDIYSYIYKDSVRSEFHIGSVNINAKYEIKVRCTNESYIVKFNRNLYSFERSQEIKWGYKNILWPYFGGIRKAPHNIKILLGWK